MHTSLLLVAAGLAGLAFCAALAEPAGADSKSERAAWMADWNARIEAYTKLRDHPCGDYAFDPWAYAFIAGCDGEQDGTRSKEECKRRTDWVWERSRQCSVWQSWLLRNHNKHERSKAREPPTRVE